MSIYAEYLHGQISREEFEMACKYEEATDRAYEDAKRERIERAIHGYDEEDEEEEDD